MAKDLEDLGAEALASVEEEEEKVEIEVEIEVEAKEEEEKTQEEKLQEAVDIVMGTEGSEEERDQAARVVLDQAGAFEGVKIESTSIEDPEPTPEEAEAIVAQKKARIAQVMTRGITNEKLQIVFDACVPDGYSGKFVRDSEGDIIRYTNLGFGFTYVEGAIGLHGSAGGRVRVGDVVLMTITLEDREILKTVKMEKMLRNISAGKDEYKRRSEKHAEEGGPSPIDLAP